MMREAFWATVGALRETENALANLPFQAEDARVQLERAAVRLRLVLIEMLQQENEEKVNR
jgi:hypothetical protein